jgi:hypothetical protein
MRRIKVTTFSLSLSERERERERIICISFRKTFYLTLLLIDCRMEGNGQFHSIAQGIEINTRGGGDVEYPLKKK